jgi:arylformamidase
MIFDLSHAVENGMPTLPGHPEACIENADLSGPLYVTRLDIGSHTGTHIDAASHYVPGATTIDAYPLEGSVVTCVVMPVLGLTPDEAIVWPSIEPWLTAAPAVAGEPSGTLTGVTAVALHTGWDSRWGSDDYDVHPYPGDEAARRLVAADIGLAALDALNIDSTPQQRTSVHEILLGNDVLVVENLRGLEQLESGRPYRFAFLPLRLTGRDASPVRAVAWED